MPPMPQRAPRQTSRVIQSRADEERGFVRKIIALTATAVLLVALTACATSAPSGACEPRHSTGDSSSLVSADGPFLNDPAATFPTPLIAQGIQVSAVDAGKGSRVFPVVAFGPNGVLGLLLIVPFGTTQRLGRCGRAQSCAPT